MIAYHGMTILDAKTAQFQTDARSPGIWLSSSWNSAWWYQQSPNGGLIHTVHIDEKVLFADLRQRDTIKAIFQDPIELKKIQSCLAHRTLYLFNELETKVINSCWLAGYDAILIPDKTNGEEHDSIVVKNADQLKIISSQNIPGGSFTLPSPPFNNYTD